MEIKSKTFILWLMLEKYLFKKLLVWAENCPPPHIIDIYVYTHNLFGQVLGIIY